MPIRSVLTRSLLTLAAVVTLAATGAAPARAETYDVRSCSADTAATPPRAVTGAEDAWQHETNDPTHIESVRQCPPADDSDIDGLVVWTKLNSVGAPLGSFAHWRFDAPPGTTLTRLRLWRYAGKRVNDWQLYTRTPRAPT